MDAAYTLQCENLAGPGKYKNSICPAEARRDPALVVRNHQPLQLTSNSPIISMMECCNQSSVLMSSAEFPPSLDLMCDAQPNELGGPGNALNSICPSEANMDSAPAVRGSQHFQNRTSNPTEVADSLRIYYQNVRGLRTKIDDFYVATQNEDYDVIVLTETWLKDGITSVQLFGNEYSVFRRDRDPEVSGKVRGGGVLIAVKKGFRSFSNVSRIDEDLEHLWVNIDVGERHVCVGVVYLPPEQSRNAAIIERLISSISSIAFSLNSQDLHLLYGDFNLPDLCWNLSSGGYAYPEPTDSTSSSMHFLDSMSLLNLKQLCVTRNCLNRTLDLIFVNDEALPMCNIADPHEAIIPVDPLHPPLLTSLSCPALIQFIDQEDDRLLDFAKADFVSLNEAIRQIDWTPLNQAADVNDAVEFFTGTLRQLFPRFVPAPRPRQNPRWGNNHLRHLKRKRSKALRNLSTYRCDANKRRFNVASRKYRIYSRKLYARYVVRTQRDLMNQPKRFWAFVSEKRKESGLPSTMFLRNESADNPVTICNLFAKHFSGAFDNVTATPHQIDDALQDVPTDAFSININSFSEADVLAGIAKLKPTAVPGPDGVPSIIVTKCANALSGPLMTIFNMSIAQSKFPSDWKRSIMFPAFKKGDKRDVANYRGVTSLCAGSKLFEILVNDILFCAAKPYISIDQHGFYAGRSTTTNLLQFTSFCLNSMEQGVQVDTIYTDLKSAFDKVNHDILLAKLERIGVAHNLVRWLRSYLVNRQLCVKLGSAESDPFCSLSGVPQGSNLGPLLFNIFFNDVCLALPAECKLVYADDLKMYLRIESALDCQRLQKLVDIFFEWCGRNLLIVSVTKCSVISFSRKKTPIIWNYFIDNQPLHRTNVMKDLGVLLDSELNFREHYSYILAKANRNLGFIFRISNEFRDPYCLRSLYYSLVRSILESSAIVWCPYHNVWIERIEKVQSKFIRYALRFLPWRNREQLPPYESRCQLLGMDTLERRRTVARGYFVAKVLLGEVDASWILAQFDINIGARALRQRSFLRLPFHRTDYGQHEPIGAMCDVFNNCFSMFDFNISAKSFRDRLYRSLL